MVYSIQVFYDRDLLVYIHICIQVHPPTMICLYAFTQIYIHTPTLICLLLAVRLISRQGAVAFAAAKRGTGERERLVARESPVEELIVRGRRVLVKRDDKVRRVYTYHARRGGGGSFFFF